VKYAEIVIHSIAEDGVPDMSIDHMVGRVAFIWDGCIVSGWPIGTGEDGDGPYSGRWEPSEDRFGGPVTGVEYWIELPVPAWRLGPDLTVEQMLMERDGTIRPESGASPHIS
jgi:hypothetical protein